MNILECTWEVHQNLCQVTVIGKAPFLNESTRLSAERTLALQALKYINLAKSAAECFVMSKEPDNINISSTCVAVSFTIMFRKMDDANKYARTLKDS